MSKESISSGASGDPLPEWGTPKEKPKRNAPPTPPAEKDLSGDDKAWWPGKKEKKPRKRRRLLKIALVVCIVLVVCAGLLIGFAPAIAASMAPGYIERAAKGQIKGSIKVKKLSLGWGGKQVIGPIELRDDKDKLVGKVQATIPVGLWTVVTEQWWSKKQVDLGQIELSGDLDVVSEADGTTNLDRAVAAGPLAKPKPASGGGGPDIIKGTLKLVALTISYTDHAAPAGSPMASGIGLQRFGGDVAFTYDQSGGANSSGGLLAKVNVAGSLKGGKAGASDKLELIADVDVKQTARGATESIKADVTLTGAPIDLVDGLAGFKGTLVKSIGDRAQLKLNASGNLDKMQATLAAKSDGAQADISYLLADGVLTADKPGRLWLRSTDFVAALPSLQQKFTDLGQTIRLDAGPSVEINILSFKLPFPKDMLTGGGATGNKTSFKDLDLRAASFDMKVSVGQQIGSVALDALDASAKKTAPGTPSAAPVATTPAKMTPFIVEPLVITASAPLLSGPIRVNAATKATLDGKAAGELLVDASASGLLDAQGKLKPDSLKDLRAQLGLKGTSTALLQPIGTMLDLPLEMSQDIGPTVDLEIKANSLEAVAGSIPAAGAGISGIPPLDASWRLISRNLNSDGTVRVTDKLTTTGEGIVLRVGSAGPLVQRVLASGKKDAAGGAAGGSGGGGWGIEVAGTGKIDVTVKDLSLDMSKLIKKAGDTNAKPLGIEDIQARADVRIDDLLVTMIPPASPAGSSNAPKSALAPGMAIAPPPAPIILSRTTLLATLKPGEAPSLTLDSTLSHEGAPFTLAARASAPASVLSKSSATPAGTPSASAAPSSTAASKNVIEQLIGYQATVRVDIKNAPRSLTKVVPSLASAFEPGDGKDTAAEVKRLLSGLLGGTVDVVIESSPEPAASGANAAIASQRAKIDVKSAGAIAVVAANLKPDSIAVQQMTLDANLTPSNANPLLAALTAAAPTLPTSSASPNPAAQATPSTNNPGDLRPATTITTPGTPSAPAGATPVRPAKSAVPMTLAEAFTLRAAIEPFTLPLETKNGSPAPKWSAAPEIVAKITTSAPITLRNVPVGEGKESASLRNLNIVSLVPLAGVMADTDAAKALAMVPTKVTADLVRPSYAGNAAQGAAGELFANLDVDAQIPAGKGNLSAVVQLKDVNTAIAESILGKPAYLVGALGDRLQATIRFEQQSIAGSTDAKRTDIRADLESARLIGASIHATMDDQAIRADSAKLTWTPSIEWANLYMLGGEAAKAQNVEPGAQLTQETTFTLDLKKLAIAPSKKDGDKSVQGPLKPGVFALDTTLSAPSMTLKRPDGKTIRLDDIRAALVSRDAPGSIGFGVNIAKVSGEGSDASKSSQLAGTIDKLCDAAGNVTSDTAELTTDGSLDSLPTALVDALANQKGLLVDALGAIVTLNIKADHLSQKSGSLQLSTTAPRANTIIQGSIQNNIFTQNGTIEVNVIEVVEPFVKRLAGGLPVVDTIVKTPQDTRGLIKTENLTAPADGKDMSKLNGTITVALGTARFEAVGLFSQLLKITGGRQSGAVGQKIEPFVIKADHGVLTYERFKFPLGEFTVETKGTVDLVNRTVNVVAYVPLFALADETVGLLGGNLLGNLKVLDRNTLVPIKVSGSMDKPKIEPDVETFVKENAAKLLPDPKKVLEDPKKAIEDFLKNIKKGK